ncbi:DEAD/DEAH box helicase family protein [Ureaplasma canigenitalium]|uniref:DEAD/DEAH box helicase family protein n=1 Tax=Ureaplasma canigenitalium TaxID=42092 RepID=UPI0004E21F30|nr:DEAD/DEAH box helicase family protein [Ureaplasma canigenitalium]
MKLSTTQQWAVNDLVSFYDENKSSQVYFKAPTGSGKTFMIANVINEIGRLNTSKQFVFVIATLSSGDLPAQMENNLNQYKQYLSYFRNNIEVTHIKSPSLVSADKSDTDYNLIAKPNCVYIFGKSSFGANKILTEQGILHSFLNQIEEKGYQLIYIRDEAHYGDQVKVNHSKKGLFHDYDNEALQNLSLFDLNLNFEGMMQKIAHFIIKMTATPKCKNIEQVIITEEELNKDTPRLLKSELNLNVGLSGTVTDAMILDTACLKFKEIKQEYSNPVKEPGLVGIHPCMLIQVANKKKMKEEEFFNEIKELLQVIKKHQLTYAVHFTDSDEKKSDNKVYPRTNTKEDISLSSISRNSSGVDCIIFKIGPSIGWNIPRACMLVQVRNVKSINLSIQTIGRIRRNPNPEFTKANPSFDYDNSIMNQFYLYTQHSPKNKDWFFYQLIDEFRNKDSSVKKFHYGIINTNINRDIIESDAYIKKVLSLLSVDLIRKELSFLKSENTKDENKLNTLKYYIAPRPEIYESDNTLDEQKKDSRKIKKINNLITNLLELDLYIDDVLEENKMYFSNHLTQEINRFINSNYSVIAKNHPWITKNLIWFYIINNLLLDIRRIYVEIKDLYTLKKERHFEYTICTEKRKLPDSRYQYVSECKFHFSEEFTEEKMRYAYYNTSKDKKKRYIHYLDSKNELLFTQKLFDQFKIELNQLKNEYPSFVNLWAKNPLHGPSFQYYKSEHHIATSYPDFVFKFKEHELIIEIKDYVSDYDQKKTDSLEMAYKGYIEDALNNLNHRFDEHHSLTLLLIKIDKQKGSESLTVTGGSTNEKINQTIELFNKNNQRHGISFFIKYLVDLFKTQCGFYDSKTLDEKKESDKN